MTRRQQIIEMLKKQHYSVQELSDNFGSIPEEIVIDLKHIEQSIYPTKLKQIPPECKWCGFIFKDRKKKKPPSKCPKCRKEAIIEPKYYI